MNRILRMHADRPEELSELEAGDIGVIIGFKEGRTGDTIGSEGAQILLEEMHFPIPVISVAIEPNSLSDGDKLRSASGFLHKKIPPSPIGMTMRQGSWLSAAWVSCTWMYW